MFLFSLIGHSVIFEFLPCHRVPFSIERDSLKVLHLESFESVFNMKLIHYFSTKHLGLCCSNGCDLDDLWILCL